MDIKKVKDLSKLSLNNQDVMIKAIVEIPVGKASGLNLDLSHMNKEDKDAMEKIKSLEIVAKGQEVTGFEIGQYISLKANRYPDYDALTEDTTERIFVFHMNQIAYAINKSDYEL